MILHARKPSILMHRTIQKIIQRQRCIRLCTISTRMKNVYPAQYTANFEGHECQPVEYVFRKAKHHRLFEIKQIELKLTYHAPGKYHIQEKPRKQNN